MNTILTAKKRLAQGYTHVFLASESSEDFESCIKDSTYCVKSREEAIDNICSERGIDVADFDMVEGRCFIWDIAEEIQSLTSCCTRDRETGNIIEFFPTIGCAKSAIREYEKSDKYEGVYSPDFYEVGFRKPDGHYIAVQDETL